MPLITFIQQNTRNLARANWQKKDIKKASSHKEKVKLSLFVNDIIYKPKTPQNTIRTNKFSSFRMQNQYIKIDFYAPISIHNKGISKREIKKTIPLAVV